MSRGGKQEHGSRARLDGGDAPRIRDVDLAERLGFELPGPRRGLVAVRFQGELDDVTITGAAVRRLFG